MDSFLSRQRARARRLARFTLCAALGIATRTFACDICAVYTATEQGESRTGFRAGIATQYTHFGTLQDDGERVPNPEHESLDSVVTQLVLGYQVTPRVGIQLNLPFISRQFERVVDGRRTRGNVSGPGDLTLFAHGLVHSIVTETSIFRFSLLAGLKLPTGDPAHLGEELAEIEGAQHRAVSAHHQTDPPDDGPGAAPQHHHESGVHGHDLALGSGSVDGLVGGELYWSWHRAYISAALQYAIRGEGDFQYQFANDLTWESGPGVYLLLEHDHTLALQALLTGETKGKDHQAGQRLDDTAVTNLFLGPRLVFTWGTSLAAEAGFELPVYEHNTALQIVPDYRLRAAAIWRF
jgi:hypothetical protein